MDTVGDRLDYLMKYRRIKSQNALARRSGVPQSTINRLLSDGVQNPDLTTLRKLADALQVPSLWLADGLGKGPDGVDSGTVLLPEQSELLELFGTLSTTQRAALLRFLKDFAGDPAPAPADKRRASTRSK